MLHSLAELCRGEAELWERLLRPDKIVGTLFRLAMLTTICGCAYGFSIGLWRSPLQGYYAAIKFPLLLLLTAAGNLMINGMLGQLLGSGLSFRQSAAAVLSSFAILAATVGGLAPVAIFLMLNLPAATTQDSWQGVNTLIVLHTLIIACAGIAATLRLHDLLKATAGPARARHILIVWLAANLFFGAQLSWNLRPYFGSPDLPVRFIRDNPFDGTFYGAVYRAAGGMTP